PLALESDDARAAADGALAGERLILLVPRVDGRYARVGTVARVENEGDLPGGQRALVLRGLYRAVVGVGVPSDRPGLWVEAQPVRDATVVSEGARERARESRAGGRAMAEGTGPGRWGAALSGGQGAG